jgi:hypothetical protein
MAPYGYGYGYGAAGGTGASAPMIAAGCQGYEVVFARRVDWQPTA